MEDKELLNGNIYDIGQTVNGVSRFLWLNETWYYFEERLSRKYEYDQVDLTETVLNYDGFEDVTLIGNIFTLQEDKQSAIDNWLVEEDRNTALKGRQLEVYSCMLSILDSISLHDNSVLEEVEETLSEIMFRKMRGYNIDLNKELGFTHLKPVSKK